MTSASRFSHQQNLGAFGRGRGRCHQKVKFFGIERRNQGGILRTLKLHGAAQPAGDLVAQIDVEALITAAGLGKSMGREIGVDAGAQRRILRSQATGPNYQAGANE